jgi:hypothetical protein
LEHEIRWKTKLVATNSLVKRSSGYAIENGKIVVDHDLLPADKVDAPLDRGRPHYRYSLSSGSLLNSFHVGEVAGRTPLSQEE